MSNKMFDRFGNRGNTRGGNTGNSMTDRVVVDNRKPIYLVLILDTSTSMEGTSLITLDDGSTTSISKIEQLNDGMKKVIKSLKNIEASSPLFKIYLQVIHLDSYGQALFPEFKPVSRGFEEIKFEADGCTQLGASLNTLKTYISHKFLRDERVDRENKGYNKAVSVILMSDGQPTDSNGVGQEGLAYKHIIDEFKDYLTQMDYARNVDMFSIAVGDDACEEMLKYFSDGDDTADENSRFYRVDECESIASKLDFVTRQSIAHHTTMPVMGDDEDEDDYDEDDSEDDEFVDDDYDEDDDAQDSEYEDIGEEGADDGNDDGEEPDEDAKVMPYEIDILKCKKDRCMSCINKCPEGAIVVRSGAVVIDTDKCIGCGACESECPYEAIHECESDDSLDELFEDID